MRIYSDLCFAFFLFVSVIWAAEQPQADVNAPPPPGKCSDQTYQVRWLPEVKVELDGRADEVVWKEANIEKRFVFPWKQATASETEFRALCNDKNFYFSFHVHDADIVVLERLRDEEDEVLEDRMEIYLCLDEQMKNYFCFETDSRGRVFDYSGSYYRRFDAKWKFEGLETKATPLPNGYEIEGRVPLKSFVALGFPELRPGVKIRCGLYRAEFSHDRSGKPVEKKESIHNLGRQTDGSPPLEEWMSWVDPKIKEPDFHIPAALGWLEIIK
ncbi:MAG: carbohydrate-binding family 9-like protein [Kiritimatiellae bacterium]|nr:carbohydrate-binding family 9-like protein [Kiritimatiellia bacterium]MDD5519781.1 carbohydrate-binding family 9-like protein [Kiritimatiellia bacterium]